MRFRHHTADSRPEGRHYVRRVQYSFVGRPEGRHYERLRSTLIRWPTWRSALRTASFDTLRWPTWRSALRTARPNTLSSRSFVVPTFRSATRTHAAQDRRRSRHAVVRYLPFVIING